MPKIHLRRPLADLVQFRGWADMLEARQDLLSRRRFIPRQGANGQRGEPPKRLQVACFRVNTFDEVVRLMPTQ